MTINRSCLALLLATGVSAVALAQSTEQVVKLPNEIEYKAPLRPGAPPAAVVYGDPNKQSLYVTRVKFPAGFKVMRIFIRMSALWWFSPGLSISASASNGMRAR
jgi:hypothetical protein